MTWVRLDDNIFSNRKVMPLSPSAKLLHLVGICYCAQSLTDGEIVKGVFPELAARSGAKRRHIDELVAAALWHDRETHWVVNDYLEYNPPREKVLKEREDARIRKESWRQSQRDGRGDNRRDGRTPRSRTPSEPPLPPAEYVPPEVPDALPRAALPEHVKAIKHSLHVVESEAS
jgi:hypothetical protein